MRKLLLCSVFMAAVLGISQRAGASEGFDDLAKMAKAGVNEDVMMAYVSASPIAYDLSVDEILFFSDLGVSKKVITAVIQHGKDLREAGLIAKAQASAPPPVTQAVAPPPPQQIPQDNQVQEPVIGGPNDQPIAPAPTEVIDNTPIDAAPITYSSTTVIAPPPDQANISFFYDALTPYGQWVELDGNWVWQPSVAQTNPDWRPYCHSGHWVYTDVGWAWHSDYSWGWAPFHYGRWSSNERLGWVWTPDTTWGPAWVSWRNDDAHVGWAPLPPAAKFEVGVGLHFGGHGGVNVNFGLTERDYTFVPVEHVCDTTIVTYVVPRTEVVTVYRQTTVIENAVVYRDDRVVSAGISIDLVNRKTHRDIHPIVIVDVNIQAGQPIHGNRETSAEFAVYRPKIAAAAPIDPRVVQARRDEELKRAQIRQQEQTARTQIHQQNVTEQQAAREAARTGQVQARNDARTQETIARQQADAAKVQARKDAEVTAAQTHAQEKDQRLAADEAKLKARKDAEVLAAQTRAQEKDQRQAADDAKLKARKDAEVLAAQTHAQEKDERLAADAQKQSDNQRTAEQKRAADQAADLQRKADRDKAAEAKRQQALAAEQQHAADVAAREQAAKAKPDADVRAMGGRDADAKAPVADTAQEQARKDAAAAKEQAKRDADAKARAAAAAKEDAKREAAEAKRAQQAPPPPATPDSDPKDPKDPKKKKRGGADSNPSDGGVPGG